MLSLAYQMVRRMLFQTEEEIMSTSEKMKIFFVFACNIIDGSTPNCSTRENGSPCFWLDTLESGSVACGHPLNPEVSQIMIKEAV